jgi:hypothetical protein
LILGLRHIVGVDDGSFASRIGIGMELPNGVLSDSDIVIHRAIGAIGAGDESNRTDPPPPGI